jgi:hypothetical protein
MRSEVRGKCYTRRFARLCWVGDIKRDKSILATDRHQPVRAEHDWDAAGAVKP